APALTGGFDRGLVAQRVHAERDAQLLVGTAEERIAEPRAQVRNRQARVDRRANREGLVTPGNVLRQYAARAALQAEVVDVDPPARGDAPIAREFADPLALFEAERVLEADVDARAAGAGAEPRRGGRFGIEPAGGETERVIEQRVVLRVRRQGSRNQQQCRPSVSSHAE